jgi:hypothetical protein
LLLGLDRFLAPFAFTAVWDAFTFFNHVVNDNDNQAARNPNSERNSQNSKILLNKSAVLY